MRGKRSDVMPLAHPNGDPQRREFTGEAEGLSITKSKANLMRAKQLESVCHTKISDFLKEPRCQRPYRTEMRKKIEVAAADWVKQEVENWKKAPSNGAEHSFSAVEKQLTAWLKKVYAKLEQDRLAGLGDPKKKKGGDRVQQ